ncbi:MAG: hypothetical protein HW414_1715 [Dehalococcoidia bacterium]|nr:hypothetical protein [Dehalococcoidia bacterium]
MKGWLKKLLSPAEDPRKTYSSVQERPQELLQKVVQARANLATTKAQLVAKVTQAKQKHEQLQSRSTQDPFVLQIQETVAQEVKGLELEVAGLDQEEQGLALIEQHLTTQVEALSARHETLEAKHQATEARSQARKALEKLPGELAEVGIALEKAELMSGSIQARTSVLEHLANLGTVETSTTIRDPAARQLANRYAAGAVLTQSETQKRQLEQGFKMLLEMEYKYGQLQSILVQRQEANPPVVTLITALVDETYRQGLSILEDGLELVETIGSPGETQPQRLRMDDLLHQAGRCLVALNQTRIELAPATSTSDAARMAKVTETLQKTAKEVREAQQVLKSH